jgi:hypothetical protein
VKTGRRAAICGVMLTAIGVYGASLSGIAGGRAQGAPTPEERLSNPAIQYLTRPTNDPVARLQRSIDAGQLRLDAATPVGYVRSLLRALGVSETSQMMVFVRDSLQSRIISAKNPRALYFNDAVAVGFVPGGLIEIAAQDPEQGVQFYAVNPHERRPQILRRTDCLSCHNSRRSGGVAGMIEPMTHRRPLEQRWGGWYVTGQMGALRHFGNVDLEAARQPADTDFNWASLAAHVDVTGYAAAHSDVVALLVFEHQMQAMNLMTRAAWDQRILERTRAPEAREAVEADVKELVEYFLFAGEARLPGRVKGLSGFAEYFARQGPADHRGRSLRDLDLERRLFKFPCSYTIYSEQFDHLPGAVKTAVYARLWAVLSGADKAPVDTRLTAADRRAILEILRDTKHDLPASWR